MFCLYFVISVLPVLIAATISRPTLPCCRFRVRWEHSCWWAAWCCRWEPWERDGMSPWAEGWCGTGHWECILQRRTWILEGLPWETATCNGLFIHRIHNIFNERTGEVRTSVLFAPKQETVAASQGTVASFSTGGGTIMAAWSVTWTGRGGFKQKKNQQNKTKKVRKTSASSLLKDLR